jgi:predicted small secreted protein
MKKLLLVLMVVALTSFLFVGCLPTTPAEGEGEGEGEPGICPTVAVTTQVAVGTKTYIKGGKQTITVTFAVPTEPVAVYVGAGLKTAPALATEVVMYADADKKVYTGDFVFGAVVGDCGEAYIYVDTCLECDYCKYPYTVDTTHPYALLAVTADECVCEGVALTFKSTSSTVCATTTGCCGDDCSGLFSWSIDLYNQYPFDVCCNTPCVTPVYSCSGA